MNKIQLIGRMTRDPILSRSAIGKGIVSFDIAIDTARKDASGGKVALYVPCKYFERGESDKLVDNIIRYNKKGSQVGIVGHLSQRKYHSKKADMELTATEVIVDEIDFLTKKPDEENAEGEQPDATQDVEEPQNAVDQPVDELAEMPY